MRELQMVSVATVGDAFEARVLVARLGSEGILAQLRGGVDGPYPLGDVQVLVPVGELATARELLLADAVEDALGGGDPEAGGERRLRVWRGALAITLVLLLGVLAVTRL